MTPPISVTNGAPPAGAADDLSSKEYSKAVSEVQETLDGQPQPPPLAPKSLRISDIKRQLPAHLFERHAWKSLMYTALDLAVIAVLGYAATYIESDVVPPLVRSLLLWPLYWAAQGCVMTGVWVIAHECGHQAFSDSAFLNNSVGLILHSALLVPYHPWRISHGQHHKNTCSIENDTVFSPEEGLDAFGEAVSESPIGAVFGILRMLLIGWPAYLIGGFSGPKKHNGKRNDHFTPWSVYFRERDFWGVILSDVVLAMVVGTLVYLSYTYGVGNVMYYYGIPYLVVNSHLVSITYLQHTDTFVPHYRESEFTFERGALSTVDRSFGWFIDGIFHHITDTHVVHHLFSQMPWYHAVEATPIVREYLGDYYLADPTPFPLALYRAWARCKYVEKHGDIVFFKGFGENGAIPPTKES